MVLFPSYIAPCARHEHHPRVHMCLRAGPTLPKTRHGSFIAEHNHEEKSDPSEAVIFQSFLRPMQPGCASVSSTQPSCRHGGWSNQKPPLAGRWEMLGDAGRRLEGGEGTTAEAAEDAEDAEQRARRRLAIGNCAHCAHCLTVRVLILLLHPGRRLRSLSFHGHLPRPCHQGNQGH